MSAVADYLQRLGWQQPEVEKIVAGADQSSIHDIAGVKLDVEVVPELDAVALPDLMTASLGAQG